MPSLTNEDLRRCLFKLPAAVKDLLRLRTASDCLSVAGGFIRATIAGEDPSDIDITGASPEVLDAVCSSYQLARLKAGAAPDQVKVHRTQNAITVSEPGQLPVQFITRWTYPEDADRAGLLDSFDFTVAQAAIWWRPEGDGPQGFVSRANERFYADLAAKRLTYTSPVRDEDAGGSMLRVLKFAKRGYHIDPNNLAAVCARLISGMPITEETPEACVSAGIRRRLRLVDPLPGGDHEEME